MKVTTHLRKMQTLLDEGQAQYILPLYDVLEPAGKLALNPLVGSAIRITFENDIRCIETGRKINKTFGEGLSYEAFLTSPLAAPSIVRPELSRIHEGIALRDLEWEMAHHNQPHVVYLARTSDIKVGVTRTANVPSRWIDQGASQAALFAITPYRQLAGLIEVALKDVLPDKTNWQAMLKGGVRDERSLIEVKNEIWDTLPSDWQEFYAEGNEITDITYPMLEPPQKVRSLKLDTSPVIEGVLTGIKGQYLIFSEGLVLNIRSHAAFKITLETLD